jgi:hypothetical protein
MLALVHFIALALALPRQQELLSFCRRRRVYARPAASLGRRLNDWRSRRSSIRNLIIEAGRCRWQALCGHDATMAIDFSFGAVIPAQASFNNAPPFPSRTTVMAVTVPSSSRRPKACSTVNGAGVLCERR